MAHRLFRQGKLCGHQRIHSRDFWESRSWQHVDPAMPVMDVTFSTSGTQIRRSLHALNLTGSPKMREKRSQRILGAWNLTMPTEAQPRRTLPVRLGIRRISQVRLGSVRTERRVPRKPTHITGRQEQGLSGYSTRTLRQSSMLFLQVAIQRIQMGSHTHRKADYRGRDIGFRMEPSGVEMVDWIVVRRLMYARYPYQRSFPTGITGFLISTRTMGWTDSLTVANLNLI